MKIDAENKLLSIDESCLSELSDENQATISGGFFLLGLLFKKWWTPKITYVHPAPQPPVHEPYYPPHPHH